MAADKGTRNRFLALVLLAGVCLPSHAECRVLNREAVEP